MITSYCGCVLKPALVYLEGEFQSEISIRISQNGSIEEIGRDLKLKENEIFVELDNEALLPGFVNTHSHSFHRMLRGRSHIGKDSAATFWGWRDEMYSLVENINWPKLKEYCLAAFTEMLSAGITTVGEFHYVHHGDSYFDLDSAVLAAAKESGIRIVLIQTLYERAGFDSPPLHPVQRTRFVSSYDDFIKSVTKIMQEKPENATIAVAAHSLRAVHEVSVKKLREWAANQGVPFHIHLEEQPKELSDCQISLSTNPSDLLLGINPAHDVTAVHCTFTPIENAEKLAAAGVNISICPCTEGYLGDGVPFITQNSFLCLGTDCNNRISFLEEMRWMAFSQATKRNSRSVASLTAKKLMDAATTGGARSLMLHSSIGRIQVGFAFDFMTVDLNSPLLRGHDSSSLLDSIVFSLGNREIVRSGVAGRVLFQRGFV